MPSLVIYLFLMQHEGPFRDGEIKEAAKAVREVAVKIGAAVDRLGVVEAQTVSTLKELQGLATDLRIVAAVFVAFLVIALGLLWRKKP